MNKRVYLRHLTRQARLARAKSRLFLFLCIIIASVVITMDNQRPLGNRLLVAGLLLVGGIGGRIVGLMLSSFFEYYSENHVQGDDK